MYSSTHAAKKSLKTGIIINLEIFSELYCVCIFHTCSINFFGQTLLLLSCMYVISSFNVIPLSLFQNLPFLDFSTYHSARGHMVLKMLLVFFCLLPYCHPLPEVGSYIQVTDVEQKTEFVVPNPSLFF